MSDGPELLVSISLQGLEPADRLKAAEIAFRHASRTGIDSINVQAGWMETPPKDVAAAVTKWLKTGKRGSRWNAWRSTSFEHPSPEDVALALSASPYIVAVNLMLRGQQVVGACDADDVSLQIDRADWDGLRPDFEDLLGSLRIEVEELRQK